VKHTKVYHNENVVLVDPVVAEAHGLLNGQNTSTTKLWEVIADNAKASLAEIEARKVLEEVK